MDKYALDTMVKSRRESIEGQTEMGHMMTPTRSAMMRIAPETERFLMTKMNLKDCVSFIVDWYEYKGGVEKKKHIFRGFMGDGTVHWSENIFVGVSVEHLVTMTKCFRPYLAKAFPLIACIEDESKRRIDLKKN